MEGSLSTERGARVQVRLAQPADAASVAAAVRALLLELSGEAPPEASLEGAARSLLEDPSAGAVLLAGDGEEIAGVLGASWQTAIHVPGRYALIQDLWVSPDRRGESIGRRLLLALFDLAVELEIVRVEVGLPSERFPGLHATEAFYLANGFSHLGPRMRQALL
jgi:GNAT superfamily N-acetyltransferase